jgi:hypothetical protein
MMALIIEMLRVTADREKKRRLIQRSQAVGLALGSVRSERNEQEWQQTGESCRCASQHRNSASDSQIARKKRRGLLITK